MSPQILPAVGRTSIGQGVGRLSFYSQDCKVESCCRDVDSRVGSMGDLG